jgi:hypothetical protein
MHVKVAVGAKGEIAESPGKLLKWIKDSYETLEGAGWATLAERPGVYH